MAKNNIWIAGHHAIEAVLRTSPERAIELLVVENTNPAQHKIVELAKKQALAISLIDKSSLSKRCGTEQHQGIALSAKPKLAHKESALDGFVNSLANPLLLILDQVQDPHNFGACLRTADAAGVDAVIVAKDNAAPITAVVQKVASGAAETMPIYRVANLARCIDSLKKAGVWIIGTSDKARETLYQHDFTGAVALVMGAEGKGLRQLTEAKCDSLVSLPMAGDIVTSLNVSVATGICLYEVVRQRT